MISQLCRRRILGCNRQYQHYQSLQNVVSSSALTNSNVNSPFQRKQYPFSSTHHHQAFHSRPAETEPASLIIDTDAGIDDAQAMYLALTHPTADIAAITVSYGNVSVGQATENVAKLLHETKRTDVPFHVGASSPLFGPTTTASYAHGTDGYGDTGLPAAPSHVQPSDKPAAHAIVDLLTKEPGKHTLVLLGPHTNLAHALALEPELHTYAKKLIFLGGNTTGLGNITAAAEFNMFADPEAADIVLNNFPNGVMIPWETVLAHGVPWRWMDKWYQQSTPFMQKVSRRFYHFFQPESSPWKTSGYPFADPLAVAAALEWEDIVLNTEPARADVEVEGKLCRGQTVIERRDLKKLPHLQGNPTNVHIMNKINIYHFCHMMDRARWNERWI